MYIQYIQSIAWSPNEGARAKKTSLANVLPDFKRMPGGQKHPQVSSRHRGRSFVQGGHGRLTSDTV